MFQTFRGGQLLSGLKTNVPRRGFQNTVFLTSCLLMKQAEDFIFLVVFIDAKLCEKSFSCMKKKSPQKKKLYDKKCLARLDHALGVSYIRKLKYC